MFFNQPYYITPGHFARLGCRLVILQYCEYCKVGSHQNCFVCSVQTCGSNVASFPASPQLVFPGNAQECIYKTSFIMCEVIYMYTTKLPAVYAIVHSSVPLEV